MTNNESQNQQKHVANFILESAGGFRRYVLREYDRPNVVGFNEPERGIHWKAEVDRLLVKLCGREPPLIGLRNLSALALLAVVRGYDRSYPVTSKRLAKFLNDRGIYPNESTLDD